MLEELREKGDIAIDDELAARLGFDDLGALREAVGGQINGQHSTALRQALKKILRARDWGCRQLFDTIDADGDGTIDKGELLLALKCVSSETRLREGASL